MLIWKILQQKAQSQQSLRQKQQVQKTVKKNHKKVQAQNRPKMKSKFATKYQDRIHDIKVSEQTRLENIKMYEKTGSINRKEETTKTKNTKRTTNRSAKH